MEIINYVLSVIVVFLGLIIGIIIAKYTKEELQTGKKYFTLLQKLFLFIISLLLLFFFKLNIIYIIILSILFIIFLFFIKLKKNIIMYNLLAIVLFISSSKEIYFIYISSLIFLYGIPTGTLFYYKKGNVKKFFKYYVWFLMISLLLFFSFYLISL